MPKAHERVVRLTKLTARQIYPPEINNYNSNLASKRLECLSLLKNCTSMKQLYQVHAQIEISGLHSDPIVTAATTHFCALHPDGSLSYGRLLTEQSNYSVLSSWNNLIRGHSIRNSPKQAIWVFLSMRGRGIRPDEYTYPFLFKACAAVPAIKEGKQIHSDAMKRGEDSVVYVQNSLILFYGSLGKIGDAHRVFDDMRVRTVVSWNSIVSACVENSKFFDSMELFARMRECGFEPDEFTMVSLLSACAVVRNLSLGKWVHSQLIEKGLTLNSELGTSLVDMYAKCGDVYFASRVFDRMTERSVQTWSAMILGFAQHGRAMEALEIFKKMSKSAIQPNYVTYLGVLCACSHVGLVEDGRRFFQEMQDLHGIKPTMAHYGAMVDCFGRAALLREAYTFIRNMPMKPDAVIWRTLLSACNIHDVNDYSGVGEKVRKSLLELEPRKSGNFVMVANKYADVGMWEKAESIRRGMRDRGLKKMAGVSCVQVGESIHRFFSGNESQVAYEGIYLVLNGLNLHLKMVNYEESI